MKKKLIPKKNLAILNANGSFTYENILKQKKTIPINTFAKFLNPAWQKKKKSILQKHIKYTKIFLNKYN